jgi:hypothetical protein
MALTRTTQQQEEIKLSVPYLEAFRSVLSAFKKVGHVQSVQEKFGRIVGTIGSGGWNMNPANLTIQVQPDGQYAKLVIVATAQEGLIPQNTAAGAISRLLDAI